MGYSDKEKAGILSVSESAVRTRKYRLNKTQKAKLQLNFVTFSYPFACAVFDLKRCGLL